MKRISIFSYFRSRRLQLLISLAVVLLLGSLWFQRNFHLYFDAHHLYDDANFFHWCAGWFHGFEYGPLEATLYFCPKTTQGSGKGDFTSYRWHLKNRLSNARSSELLVDREGLHITVTELPETHSILLHCWHKTEFDRWDETYKAFHRSNTLDRPSPSSESIGSNDIRHLSMIAWQRTRIDFKDDAWHSPFALGTKFEIPENDALRDWAFRINASGRSDDQGFQLEIFVAYDPGLESWRIYDRDWSGWEATNTWIYGEDT